MQALERARAAYEAQGRELIARCFPEYENKIAVGLVGHGSECFGYDDYISSDHDLAPGFDLWLDRETYGKIGHELQRAYEELFPGPKERSAQAGQIRGVHTIEEHYLRLTGSSQGPGSWRDWLYIPSFYLAEASNGQVWRDDLGRFTQIRQHILTGMPEDVRIKRLAARVMTMAQAGQYNYRRCLRHREPGAAMLAMTEFVNAACAAIFLLNRRHMPYYKWQLRALGELPLLGDMKEALEHLLTGENDLAGQDLKEQVVEDICAQVAAALQAQGLSCGGWDYLEPHALDMLHHIQDPEIRSLHVMEG